ncbi:MAG: hypothetical protein IJ746_04430 [Ruminococcus sp.]|nr:hypothetical protein [Ruminococcus sp.]
MKTVDLTKLYANDKELIRLIEELKKRYKCNWDDAVHDSYNNYIKEIVHYSSMIHKECDSIKETNAEIGSVNIEEMKNTINDLCRRVDSL